jgi:transposase
MSYSIDAREMAIKYLSTGHTLQEAHIDLGIGLTTLKAWKKRLKENGNLEKAPLERYARKFSDEELRIFLKNNPTATLKEIAAEFGGSPMGAFHALRRLKITIKRGSKNHRTGRGGATKVLRNASTR